jgi:ABC-type amino acid transport substrate-binding protein
MEPIMAAELKRAQLVSVRSPQTRERELEAGRIDVFMTDFPYSRKLVDTADWVRIIAPPRPLHVMPYAYAAKPGDDQWLSTLEEFVARIKRDGRLQGAAAKHGLAEIVAR